MKAANAAKPKKVTLPSKLSFSNLLKTLTPFGSEGFFVDFRFRKSNEFIMDIKKTIHIFEPLSENDGAQVTIATDYGRKTFQLARPLTDKEQPPLAIESFAIDPEYYAELMKRVESLNQPSK